MKNNNLIAFIDPSGVSTTIPQLIEKSEEFQKQETNPFLETPIPITNQIIDDPTFEAVESKHLSPREYGEKLHKKKRR